MVYTSDSLALSLLEVLVHLQNAETLPAYSAIPIDFNEALVHFLDPATLPAHWQEHPPPSGIIARGDQWIAESVTPVLRVPSVILQVEYNYLLNPGHPAFPQIAIGNPEPFAFDARLVPPAAGA
jgi:RES domain-containing protein